ncbi:MAG: hypothetical protein HN341_13835 [Verrucomicrobia bacterium]|nr:hypothetical protein [Verrucomicrobiota bacterium]
MIAGDSLTMGTGADLTLDGLRISLRSGQTINLNGNNFFLSSGTIGKMNRFDVTIANGCLQGNGTINLVDDDDPSMTGSIVIGSTVDTTGFTGTFNLQSGSLRLPAITKAEGSFELEISGTGVYDNTANVAFTGLTINGNAVADGRYNRDQLLAYGTTAYGEDWSSFIANGGGAIAVGDVLEFSASEDIALDKGSGPQDGRKHLLVGSNATGPYSSLVAFDFSGVGLGSGMVVDSVIIEFYNDDSDANGGANALTMLVNQYNYDFVTTAATYESPATGDTTAGGTLGTSFGSFNLGAPAGGGGNGSLLATLPTSAALERAVQSAINSQGEFRLILSDSNPNTTDERYVRIGRISDTNDTPVKLWLTTRPAQGSVISIH